MNTVTEPLLAFLDQYVQAWQERDESKLRQLWDDTYERPVCKAEERPQPLLTLADIVAYYRQTLDNMLWMEIVYEPIAADIHGDIAWIVAKGRWRGQNRHRSHESGGEAIVCFWLRRVADRWRLIQSIQAPDNKLYVS